MHNILTGTLHLVQQCHFVNGVQLSRNNKGLGHVTNQRLQLYSTQSVLFTQQVIR